MTRTYTWRPGLSHSLGPAYQHGLGIDLLTLAIGTVAFGDMSMGEVAERQGVVHTVVEILCTWVRAAATAVAATA
jgi:hypothetical protein|eukprot:COSAG01_NODE_2063_length_8512_cov_7.924284_4_plen_75_part_00